METARSVCFLGEPIRIWYPTQVTWKKEETNAHCNILCLLRPSYRELKFPLEERKASFLSIRERFLGEKGILFFFFFFYDYESMFA